MAGLVGLRLAVYDELLRTGALDVAACTARLSADGAPAVALTQALPDAVAWLSAHRLLVAHEGQWRAVILSLARMNFESNGPAAAPAAAPKPVTQVKPEPIARGATAAVQRHQREFFTMEGYREANGSL